MDGFEVFCYFGYVFFKDVYCYRWRILEEVVGLWEWVGVIWVGIVLYRGIVGGIEYVYIGMFFVS